tara:strand:- start:6942 stop:8087 length:1146 start_codon:yes stop_codon:yes gene_type:complete
MTINNDYNRKLLLDLIKLAKLSKKECSFLLNKHEKSLDTYIYKFDGLAFPPSFAYFFLSSICDTFLPLYENQNKPNFGDGKGSTRLKKYNYFKSIDHVEKKEFFDILEKCKDLDIKKKLIIPCVEYHCLLLMKLSNSEFIHDESNLLEEYVDQTVPEAQEFLNEYSNLEDPHNHSIAIKNARKLVQATSLIRSIKNFFPVAEKLRKNYMPNFVAPNETFKLPVLNSNENILFSKDFVKRNLNLKKYNDLVLINVGEDNMQGTINKDDLALIIKFEKKNRPKFENGIFAINLDGKIVIRRLQFLQFSKRTLVHIISDNKKYIDEQVSLEELKIFGEVVWKCNNFQDIQFLKHEEDIPHLFSSEENIEIPKFIETKNIKKEIA